MIHFLRVFDRNGGKTAMPFIKPNKYWPRPDWKQMLKMLGMIAGSAPLQWRVMVFRTAGLSAGS